MNAAGESAAPPATRLQLEVAAGNAAGTVIEVDERLVFGRQSDGPGRLADDPELSRHHAEITRRPPGEYVLEDLSSTNGTFLNGARLQQPALLSLGDTIELGATKLTVRALPTVAAPEAPAVDVRAATVVVDVPAAVRTPEPSPPAPAPLPPVPIPPAPPPPPPPPPPLELRLKVDLEREEAEIALDQGQAVRFRLHEGSWQIIDGDSR